ncbi:GTP pyrophosphokinase [Paenibacillus taichungensis]
MDKKMIRKERIMLMIEQFNRMNPGDHLNRSILLGTLVHAEDKDKAGEPYIEHVMRVITGCRTYEGKVVAGIHDVVEDHPEFSLEDLTIMGFTEYQVKGVDNITKREEEGERKDLYYARVMRQDNSLDAKISDLKDNSRIERLKVVTDKDRERTRGYLEAIELLSSKFPLAQ